LVGQAGCSPFRRPAPRLPLDDRPPQLQAGAPGPAAAGAWCMPDRPAGGPKLSWPILSRSYLTKRKESLRSVTGPLGPTGPYRRRTRLARRQQMADSLRRGAYLENQRARREVELASVRDCYDDPHRRSLTAPTPHPASLP
jgi:hypothetical protein